MFATKSFNLSKDGKVVRRPPRKSVSHTHLRARLATSICHPLMRRTWFFSISLFIGAFACNVSAADWSLRDVVTALFKADRRTPIDFSNAELKFLDLSGLDFKRARLTGANLHGSDLTGAILSNCDLQNAILDRATLVGVDFSSSNLEGALIRLPFSAGSPGFDSSASPKFPGANLRQARLVGRFDGGNFRGAKLDGANLGPYGDWTQNTLARRSVIVSGDFSGASLVNANLSEAILTFVNFKDADLRGVNLTNANLVGADFSGANLANANVNGADFEGTNLTTANGLDQLVGRERAINWPSARRKR